MPQIAERWCHRCGYELDDEDDDNMVSSGEVFFSGAVASNNPFAETTEDVDVDELTAAAAVEFNPFATITDDVDQEVFDPFQTIHDDDALNVPFSSEDRDTSDDAMSPSRSQHVFRFSVDQELPCIFAA